MQVGGGWLRYQLFSEPKLPFFAFLDCARNPATVRVTHPRRATYLHFYKQWLRVAAGLDTCLGKGGKDTAWEL